MATNTNKPTKSASAAAGTGSYSFSATEHNFVRRKRVKASHGEVEMGELNIVPYLDIVVNLIMFILVAQATMVALGVIDVTAPTYASLAPGPAPTPDPAKDLKLTIGIAKEGFFIAGKGAVLGDEAAGVGTELTADNVAKRPPTIPLRADGTYDYPALTLKLRQIKTLYPDAKEVFLAADAAVPYEVIVKTLDHSREDSRGPLFPNVAFSKIN
jgi:biopolymer transport protein TolR